MCCPIAYRPFATQLLSTLPIHLGTVLPLAICMKWFAHSSFFTSQIVTAMTELTSFSLFPELPLGLQRSIWIHAWKEAEPRVCQFIFDGKRMTIERKSCYPRALLQTCHNACIFIIPYFIKKLSLRSKGRVFFDPGKDTIYFGEGCDRVDALDLEGGREHVQNIAFGPWYWSLPRPSKPVIEICCRFPNVKVVTFLVDEHHSSKAHIKTLNDFNRRVLKGGKIFRFATCINANGVIEYMDEDDEHSGREDENKDQGDENKDQQDKNRDEDEVAGRG